MSNEFYVYLHKRPDGSVFYVGKGKNRRAYSSANRNQHWHNIVDKYGGFTVEFYASNLTEEDALRIEIEKISEICLDNLSNIVEGGGGITGLVHTEDVKERMSSSHKKRLSDNPEELQKLLNNLELIHKRVREDPDKRSAISIRVKNYWDNLSADELEVIGSIRSENAKNMWEDENKRKELSEAIKQSHVNMSAEVKKERSRKLSVSAKKRYESITEDQRKALVDNANKHLRSEEAIQKYKEARCRKLVLNRTYIVESRIALSRLLGVKGSLIKVMSEGDYQVKAGFFIENFDPDIHKSVTTVNTIEGVPRIFPVSGNSIPVKNSAGEIFLSVKEAGDSIINSRASDQTKQGSISEACRNGIKAYGTYWSKPSEDEITEEVFRRLNNFLEG